MVCIYCSGETNVTNSRLQRRTNGVWRRRQCTSCNAVFTTIERNLYENSLMVQQDASHIAPFERDKLFVSIYDACRHRTAAISDATAITNTILGKLEHRPNTHGIVERDMLVTITRNTLKQFDTAAYVYYQAYHPLAAS